MSTAEIEQLNKESWPEDTLLYVKITSTVYHQTDYYAVWNSEGSGEIRKIAIALLTLRPEYESEILTEDPLVTRIGTQSGLYAFFSDVGLTIK